MSFTQHTCGPWGLVFLCLLFVINFSSATYLPARAPHKQEPNGRERISLNRGWRFKRTTTNPDGLIYDNRPDQTANTILKPYILPSANDFIKDASKQYKAPSKTLNISVPSAQSTFDDSSWEAVDLPHDWAIKGPFYIGQNVPVKGGMGRLPIQGFGWYRRQLSISTEDVRGKSVYLDIDGAMSYATVWLNGNLIGGWPYSYNSFRVDLTPHLKPGNGNVLSIRLDNPIESSRWYPGGGIYRNVWLTMVENLHVAQYGTFVTTRDISAESAVVDLVVQVENKGNSNRSVSVSTDIHIVDTATGRAGAKVAELPGTTVDVPAGRKKQVNGSATVTNPKLWGPPPSQQPNLYVAVTRLSSGNTTLDSYQTEFGIRSVTYDANKGLVVNNEHIRIQGVNQHHDLGSLGAAFNLRAATRQLEVLKEVGCNAIRMSHNPPAPELLELTDRMGFLVVDEVFDMWQKNKTNSDNHLIFDDWSEPILRSFLRRDRNHPSIIIWSVGNEVGEQYDDAAGAAVARRLVNIAKEEDPTRPYTASMNYAKPNMPFPAELDVISLNYQGEGIRDAPAYAHLSGIKTSPLYTDFHKAHPGKMIFSSETAAALSTRGTYIFPVADGNSAPVNDTSGGNSTLSYVSSYELYSADFGSSADKVFAAQDASPFVAGEFVWSGWDYLGEPTPYYNTRSSYFGIIDLAGFPKDRFYLYQSRWRPDLKVAHILPHWTFPDRVGLVTPVHVFSNADEAELFVDGVSAGKKKILSNSTFRFRWDEVKYQPGELRVVTWKNGAEWATQTVKTAGPAAKLSLSIDRAEIDAGGEDLAFVTLRVEDGEGNLVPQASDLVTFEVEGPAEIVSTDNGDPTDFTVFPSKERKAFNGLALAIVKGVGKHGAVTVVARAKGVEAGEVKVEMR